MHVCMHTLQGGVPSSINVGDTLSLRFQAQDSFANDVFVGGAGTLLCIVCADIAAVTNCVQCLCAHTLRLAVEVHTSSCKSSIARQ
jgi:hypothetical protein